jgi:hypothetical protein
MTASSKGRYSPDHLSSMNSLPSLTEITDALPRVKPGLAKYCWLQAHLSKRDVSIDREFQRRFAGFYRVRRGAEWRRTFFDILQTHKTTGLTFSTALHQLARETGRVEASFASKLVASISPDEPVIDSVVLHNVGLRLPPPTSADRLDRIVRVHSQLASWYREQLASATGADLLRLFREYYPGTPVSDTKALDLVLWQIRQ